MTRRPLAALLLMLLATSCAAPAPANPARIPVGAIYPLTGPQAQGGGEELLGVRTALALARKLGVARARDIDLHVIDAQTPAEARAAVDRLIDSDHVKLIIGTYGSTLSAAIPPSAVRSGRVRPSACRTFSGAWAMMPRASSPPTSRTGL